MSYTAEHLQHYVNGGAAWDNGFEGFVNFLKEDLWWDADRLEWRHRESQSHLIPGIGEILLYQVDHDSPSSYDDYEDVVVTLRVSNGLEDRYFQLQGSESSYGAGYDFYGVLKEVKPVERKISAFEAL